jgi:hypothetical protein
MCSKSNNKFNEEANFVLRLIKSTTFIGTAAIIVTIGCAIFSDALKALGNKVLAQPLNAVLIFWLLALTVISCYLLKTKKSGS